VTGEPGRQDAVDLARVGAGAADLDRHVGRRDQARVAVAIGRGGGVRDLDPLALGSQLEPGAARQEERPRHAGEHVRAPPDARPLAAARPHRGHASEEDDRCLALSGLLLPALSAPEPARLEGQVSPLVAGRLGGQLVDDAELVGGDARGEAQARRRSVHAEKRYVPRSRLSTKR
jgi:hypothetical protein